MAGRTFRALAIVGGATFATMAFVTTAYAHVPVVSATCVDEKTELVVDLRSYSGKGRNVLTVTGDGAQLVKTEFATEYSLKREFDGRLDHTFTVKVEAWDDPDATKGWAFEKKLEVVKCVRPTTTTTTTTTPTPTTTKPSTSTPTSPPATMTTTSAAVPPVKVQTPATPLAATGASPLWTVLAGVGLIGLGAGVVFAMRRKRA
ncbi:LPXTG-motif cell wall-anchored protein [Lentzea atacamensis]|uniref:LPXTG-motif cell wall-anchored protein n=1 Tax=Lentzea atacamensis TaxID=531938 RepID=A0A316IAX3_9PSEU|nr:LPXTG cell wall anchor domain-containing protein [Lentzea atacamensis]PWK84442.1 LPXTG-motif cell wall-anchored protein [Lentzea atacamensis]